MMPKAPQKARYQALVSLKKQTGIVLVVVLVMLALLISLASNYMLTVSQNSESINTLNNRLQPEYSAYSGINYALFASNDKNQDSRLTTDGQLYHLSLADTEVFVTVAPESGHIDINRATFALMTQLFKYAGADAQTAAKLAANTEHWRQKKDVSVNQSVTDKDYESDDLPMPAHRRFYALAELASVHGVTPAMYRKIRPLITLFGAVRVNAWSASNEMFKLLGLSADDIAAIIQARQAFYRNKTAIPAAVRALSRHLSFSTNAAYYRATALAKNKHGQAVAVYTIIRRRFARDGSIQEVERGMASPEHKLRMLEASKRFKANQQGNSNE